MGGQGREWGDSLSGGQGWSERGGGQETGKPAPFTEGALPPSLPLSMTPRPHAPSFPGPLSTLSCPLHGGSPFPPAGSSVFLSRPLTRRPLRGLGWAPASVSTASGPHARPLYLSHASPSSSA